MTALAPQGAGAALFAGFGPNLSGYLGQSPRDGSSGALFLDEQGAHQASHQFPLSSGTLSTSGMTIRRSVAEKPASTQANTVGFSLVAETMALPMVT
jgi:hypothetical protein